MVVKQPSPPPLSSVARLTSARRRRRWSAVMSTARAFEGSTAAAPHAGQVTESERAPRDAGEEPMMPYSGALAVPQAFPTGLSTACVRLPFAPRPRLVILPPTSSRFCSICLCPCRCCAHWCRRGSHRPSWIMKPKGWYVHVFFFYSQH
jgi:hypothetical protein